MSAVRVQVELLTGVSLGSSMQLVRSRTIKLPPVQLPVQLHALQLRESSASENALIDVGKEGGQASLSARMIQSAPSGPGAAGTQTCPDSQLAWVPLVEQTSLAPFHWAGEVFVLTAKVQLCRLMSAGSLVILHEPSEC